MNPSTNSQLWNIATTVISWAIIVSICLFVYYGMWWFIDKFFLQKIKKKDVKPPETPPPESNVDAKP